MLLALCKDNCSGSDLTALCQHLGHDHCQEALVWSCKVTARLDTLRSPAVDSLARLEHILQAWRMMSGLACQRDMGILSSDRGFACKRHLQFPWRLSLSWQGRPLLLPLLELFLQLQYLPMQPWPLMQEQRRAPGSWTPSAGHPPRTASIQKEGKSQVYASKGCCNWMFRRLGM